MKILDKCNALIAVYMNTESYEGWEYPVGKGWCDTENLQYHKDWNWLMVVVKKIMGDVSVESEVGTTHIKEMIRQDILSALMDLEIGSVYEAVVDAINAINQHNNGTEQ